MTELREASNVAADRFRGDGERWAAVVARDRSAGAEFVYSVATTGVYCRPGCASGRPRRKHVRFHASCEAAETAGFRPCRRCRPNEPPLAERHGEAVAAACSMIETAVEPPDLDSLAQAAGMSRSHFHRVFKRVTGVTPRAYVAGHRADRVREALRTSRTVTDAIYDAGFNSSGRFYAASSEMLGMTPSTFRRGGAGETIRFAVGECSLGSILVAATPRGVCSILLGDDPGALVHELEDRFSQAEVIGGDTDFESLVARAVACVEAPALGCDLPLDIRGTTFQCRVWQELRKIPAGERGSYSEVAGRLGSPNSSRAVASACAATHSLSSFPATGWYEATVDSGATGGEWNGSGPCLLVRPATD